MLVGYVPLDTVLERLHRVRWINDTNASYIKEFVFDGLLLFRIDNNLMFETCRLDVEQGRTLLPQGVVGVEAVFNSVSGVEMVLRQRTEGFIADSYYMQNRVLFTSFSEGEIVVQYRSLLLDEQGSPMIPDDQYVLDALYYYVLWKVAELGVLNGTMDARTEDSLAKKSGWALKAAKDSANSLSEPEHKALQKITLKPYLGASRRRKLK